jgi:hypothetical protein
MGIIVGIITVALFVIGLSATLRQQFPLPRSEGRRRNSAPSARGGDRNYCFIVTGAMGDPSARTMIRYPSCLISCVMAS